MGELNKNVFPDTIRLEDMGIIKNTRKFRLLTDFRCFFEDKSLVVQKGFITDGISAPKFSWPIIGPYGPAFPAALIHDWCFSPYNKIFNWKQTNFLFLKLMKEAGVGFTMRWAIYLAVVIGSYPLWVKRVESYDDK